MGFARRLQTIAVLVLALAVVSTLQQNNCSFPEPITTIAQVSDIIALNCQTVLGDIVIGDPQCLDACNIESLFFLSQAFKEVGGSVIVRCCNSLTLVSGWDNLERVNGSIIVESNAVLQTVEAFPKLSALQGSFIAVGNPRLQAIAPSVTFQTSLLMVADAVRIERNPVLGNLSYFQGLTVIRGGELPADRSALSLLFNPLIVDLDWLQSLRSILAGVVWIEGNVRLCYAGYPQWRFGSYINRTNSPSADKGIDWRTFLGTDTSSYYIWSDTNIPYLMIQNNAPERSCGEAECHSDCPEERGCLGPDNQQLCGGACRQDSLVDTCQVDPVTAGPGAMPCDLWPPEGPLLGLWIAVFVLGGLFILCILVALIAVFVICCKKCCSCNFGDSDTFKVGGYDNPITSTLGGAVAFSSDPESPSDGTVVLRNSMVFDQFSFSGKSGSKAGKPKDNRVSFVEALPKVNTYTVNEKQNDLSNSDEIMRLPPNLKEEAKPKEAPKVEEKKAKKEPPKEEPAKDPRDEISAAVQDAEKWMATIQLQEDLATSEPPQTTKNNSEDKPVSEKKRKGSAKEEGWQKKKTKDETEAANKKKAAAAKEGTRSSNTSSQPASEVSRKESEEPLGSEPPKGEVVRSPSGVSEGGLTATSSTLDLSESVASNTPLLEEPAEEEKPERREIPLDFPARNIKLKKALGSAAFGKVYVAEARNLRKSEKKSAVVVKVLKDSASKKERDNFLKPVAGMKEMQHKNILALVGVVQEPDTPMLLLEHCEEGPLKTFLIGSRTEFSLLKEKGIVASLACDVASGVQYLHSINIAHNDLACRNCLVTFDFTAKIGDYGLSREDFKEDYYNRAPGQKLLPIRWMAPELINTDREDVVKSLPPTFKGNMWALGITLWELCTCCQWPYEDLMNEEVIELVKTASGRAVLDNPVEEGDALFPMYDLMKMCWMSPENRPTAAEVTGSLKALLPKKKKTSKSKPPSAPSSSKSKTVAKKSESEKKSTAKTNSADVEASVLMGREFEESDSPPPGDPNERVMALLATSIEEPDFMKKEKQKTEPAGKAAQKEKKAQLKQEGTKPPKKTSKDESSDIKKSKSVSNTRRASGEAEGKSKKGATAGSKQGSGAKDGSKAKQRPYSTGFVMSKPKPSRDSYLGYGADADDDDDDDNPQVVYDEDIAALIW